MDSDLFPAASLRREGAEYPVIPCGDDKDGLGVSTVAAGPCPEIGKGLRAALKYHLLR